MKRLVTLVGLLLVWQGVFALDLTKVKKTLYYECRGELSSGLYRDPDSRTFQAMAFNVDQTPWELRLIPISSSVALEETPKYCLRQRPVRLMDNGRSEKYDPRYPEFCFVMVFRSNDNETTLGNHCFITMESRVTKKNHALDCGVGDQIFFDSDRLFGLDGRTMVGSSEMPLTHFAVRKFSCQRLDR